MPPGMPYEQYIFEQVLQMNTKGYILSPNFFTLSLAGSGGLSETWVDTETDGTSASDSSIL